MVQRNDKSTNCKWKIIMTCSILCSKQTPQSKNGVLLSSQCQYSPPQCAHYQEAIYSVPVSLLYIPRHTVTSQMSGIFKLLQLTVQAFFWLCLISWSVLHTTFLTVGLECQLLLLLIFSWTGKTVVKSDYLVCHVCPHGIPLLPLDGFYGFLQKKSVNHILLLLKSDEVTQTFNM